MNKPLLAVLGLAVLAGVGFAVVKSKTNGGAGTTTVNGTDYRYQIVPARDGGYVAVIVVNGTPGDTIGPLPTVAQVEAAAATYLADLDVDAFYTLSQDAAGAWFFDGWSRGSKIAAAKGPYASEAIAAAAGSTWVAQTLAVPVPMPGGG
jgi:hypothetical protein